MVAALCVVAWLAGLLFTLAICRAAGEADRLMERMRK
jgi:hypothetical protein